MLTEPTRPRLLDRVQASTRAPLIGLILISLLSLGARAYKLDEPCQSPCTTANQHTMIFDEAYYVNAARVIVGIHPPQGDHYSASPLGTDPNAEHPQGAKLIVAGAIELFGDGPFAWRLPSLIFGSLALLGMFVLVRSAGGGRWSALGAATLLATDNLLLVHGRIFTLDIYVVTMMIWGVAFYLQDRPVLAGVVLAVGFCFKFVGPYALGTLGLLELARLFVRRRDPDSPPAWSLRAAIGRFVPTVFTSVGVCVGLLAIMGLIATPYADAEATLLNGGPFQHIAHMFSYAAQQVSPNGPQGIASYPWAWLLDLKGILYLRINPSLPGQDFHAIHPVVAFWGMPSPVIMALGMPALVFCLWRFVRRRSPGQSPEDQQLAMLAVTWFIGTWTPFAVLSVVDHRTSYSYYMVIVMPGIYVAATYAAALGWRLGRTWLRGVIGVWAFGVLVAAVLMYPFVAAF
ncbi:MAG TPA: glycosyltransferase family 39 protein [Solirubrobacteraceae bacterium]|jgi:dolichyl-phosphate-mannose--protein O-mannosyl transferase